MTGVCVDNRMAVTSVTYEKSTPRTKFTPRSNPHYLPKKNLYENDPVVLREKVVKK